MSLVKIDMTKKRGVVEFVFWVNTFDEWRVRDRAYDFKWEKNEVIFLFGGKGAKQPRLIGHATTLDDAQKVIKKYLGLSSDDQINDT